MQEIGAFGALGAAGRPRPAARRADHRRPRHPGADRPLRARHRHRPEGVVPAVQRAGRRLRPRRPDRQGGARTATSTSSTARRCGRRAARSPTSACCSPAPTPTRPKHQGITWFAIDMHQPGIDIRPLREMTGHAMFNEVFMTDARVPAVGRSSATRTTAGPSPTRPSMHERAGLGAGGGGGRGLGPARHGRQAARSAGPATSCRSGGGQARRPRRHGAQVPAVERRSSSSTWPRATARSQATPSSARAWPSSTPSARSAATAPSG